jgi:two-component system, response regulator YesN
MCKILVVDDEPRVSTGIRNYLLQSGLKIDHVITASNGFEALDYLRMESFDLVLTDIQMSMMNGIELMEAIFLEQPHLPVIVISAHENFEFAKQSIRLGARDYLIKPVELDELVRVVGKVLHEKEEAGRRTLSSEWMSDQTESLFSRRNEALMELVTEKELHARDYADLAREIGKPLKGAYYSIVSVRLDLSRGGFSSKEVTLQDRKLLKYASVNILEESLSDYHALVFYGFGNQLIAVIQMGEEDIADPHIQLKSKLNLIGQLIYMNLKQYLNVSATIGMSTQSPDVSKLPKLMEEAETAVEWRKMETGSRIFYYEDLASLGSMSMLEWIAEVDGFIQWLKTSASGDDPVKVQEESLKGITKRLTEMGSTGERFKSCFGLLVYRLYGLLFDYGRDEGEVLHRLDPDHYFRGMDHGRKIERLKEYAQGIASVLKEWMSEREQSIITRVRNYIHKHYSNCRLKIQDIAGEVHFSPAYVSALFKKEMNQNIWDYVSEVRIMEAKRLLAATDMKRYEIAYKVGYESPEHFSRMFKRYVGASPADYRKEEQVKSAEA